MHMPDTPQHGGWFQSRPFTWVLLGFLAVGGFFLATEHTAHLLGILPFAIFLLCPLMMLFMHHGGHDGHGDHSGHDGQNTTMHQMDQTGHAGQHESQSMVVESQPQEQAQQPKEGEQS